MLYERHIFVCGNERPPGHARGCCAEKQCDAIRDALKAELSRRGAAGRMRVNKAGCLDQCEHGPTLVVYPEQVWYGFVTPADVVEIVDQHLLGGRPIERLRLAEGCINAPACPHRPPKKS